VWWRPSPLVRQPPPGVTSTATGVGLTDTTAVSPSRHQGPGDAAHRARCGGEPGGEAAPGAVCGPGRAAPRLLRNSARWVQRPAVQVRANLGQRAAQKTYDITGADLTPALSWHRLGPGEAAPSEPGAVAAVARTAPVPGAGTGPRTTSRPRWPGGTAVRRRFPQYC